MNKKIIYIIPALLIIAGIGYYFGFDYKRKSESVTYKDLIRVDYPLPENKITGPLEITGAARGNWYFEATFPVVLTNWDGLIIAQHYAEAQSEWMTTDFVPFKATLEFEKPAYGERGFLILQKSNASGLPEHDDALEIPVFFK